MRHASGLNKLDKFYKEVNTVEFASDPAEKIIDAMNIKMDFETGGIESIPTNGPLLIVANHPYGGLDGVALLALLRRVRADVKVMANYILSAIPHLSDSFIPVDPFGGNNSVKNNLHGMRESIKWLQEGHVLGVFPAGEVFYL